MSAPVEMQIIGKFEGSTGTYYHLNSGSSVKARFGVGDPFVCLNSKCIAAREANECEHVTFVATYDRLHPEAPP